MHPGSYLPLGHCWVWSGENSQSISQCTVSVTAVGLFPGDCELTGEPWYVIPVSALSGSEPHLATIFNHKIGTRQSVLCCDVPELVEHANIWLLVWLFTGHCHAQYSGTRGQNTELPSSGWDASQIYDFVLPTQARAFNYSCLHGSDHFILQPLTFLWGKNDFGWCQVWLAQSALMDTVLKRAKAIPGSFICPMVKRSLVRRSTDVIDEWISQMPPLSGNNLTYWLDSHKYLQPHTSPKWTSACNWSSEHYQLIGGFPMKEPLRDKGCQQDVYGQKDFI